MKKTISFLLACSIFLFHSPYAIASSPLSEKRVDYDKEIISPISRAVEDSNKSIEKKEPLKKEPEKNIIPKEVVEKFPTEVKVKEYQDDFEKDSRPSKWEMAKNIAVYLGKSFMNDVKSYVMFYPLTKVAQAISFCLWFFPACALCKKTGFDLPTKISSYIISENAAIIARNLYNVIPMTLASFLYKWGRDTYTYMKS